MDLRNGLATICPGSHGPVLGAPATVEGPLTRRQIALRAGMTSSGVNRALDDLVDAGVVWRAEVNATYHWHFLYREHIAADFIVALAQLPLRLGRRVAAHAAHWDPAPQTLALRLPCPTTTDASGHALLDLLVVRPATAGTPPDWDDHVDRLVQALRHWSGNDTHLTVLDADAAGDEELAAGSWWLLAGQAAAGLELADLTTDEDGQPGWPAGGLPREPLGAELGKPERPARHGSEAPAAYDTSARTAS